MRDIWRFPIPLGRGVTWRPPSFNRNIYLAFIAIFLRGVAQGIFVVIFNLYILRLGITEDVLGNILAAGPYAQALGSIPAGLFMEFAGFKNAFLLVYSVTGISQIVQVALPYVPLIFGAAFIGGLGFAGDFVVRLPFLAANASEEERTSAFAASSNVHSISLAMGGLLAGFLPNVLLQYSGDLTLAYRHTLYLAGALTLAALIPSAFISRRTHRPRIREIDIRPYLHGIDRLTVKQAIVSLIGGLSVGIIVPYFNLFFVNYLGTSREFYSTIVALAFVPNFAAIALGPWVARRFGLVPSVTYLRLLILPAYALMVITLNPLVATIGFWAQFALFSMGQPLSFSFAMQAASPDTKVAASAWLNIMHWLGIAIMTPIGGQLIARSEYTLPIYLSGAAMLLCAILNHLFFISLERRPIRGVTETS